MRSVEIRPEEREKGVPPVPGAWSRIDQVGEEREPLWLAEQRVDLRPIRRSQPDFTEKVELDHGKSWLPFGFRPRPDQLTDKRLLRNGGLTHPPYSPAIPSTPMRAWPMSLLQFPPKVAGLLLTLTMAAACVPDSAPNPTEVLSASRVSNDADSFRKSDKSATAAVFAGNAQSILAAPTLVPPGAPLTPFIEARLYAIANVAMHDALNSISPRFARYADNGAVNRHANATAAVLTELTMRSWVPRPGALPASTHGMRRQSLRLPVLRESQKE